MGRKKTEFTKEQDARITQLLNDGYSLSGILSVVNSEFNSKFHDLVSIDELKH